MDTMNCWKIEWRIVNGVDVWAIGGMDSFVAVPTTGRHTSPRYDMIDLDNGQFLCQLLRHEVSDWLCRKARALAVPFNAVS